MSAQPVEETQNRKVTEDEKLQFIQMYQALNPVRRYEINVRFVLALVKSNAPAKDIFNAFRVMVWPEMWRGLAWLAFAVLVGGTVINMAAR